MDPDKHKRAFDGSNHSEAPNEVRTTSQNKVSQRRALFATNVACRHGVTSHEPSPLLEKVCAKGAR